MFKDSEGIRRILGEQERELKAAEGRGDASATALIAGRKAWVEEFVAQAELFAVVELKEKLSNAEEDHADAEAASNANAAQSVKVRIEAIREALRELQGDVEP